MYTIFPCDIDHYLYGFWTMNNSNCIRTLLVGVCTWLQGYQADIHLI